MTPNHPHRPYQIWSSIVEKNIFNFMLFDSCRAWKMLWNVFSNCKIWSKIEEMGLFLVKNFISWKSSHMSLTNLLWTYANQWGSVQIFSELYRKLILIWAFRKSTWKVDLKKSIFSYRRFSQTASLKRPSCKNLQEPATSQILPRLLARMYSVITRSKKNNSHYSF